MSRKDKKVLILFALRNENEALLCFMPEQKFSVEEICMSFFQPVGFLNFMQTLMKVFLVNCCWSAHKKPNAIEGC